MVPVSLIQKLQRAADLILQHPRAAVGALATSSLAVVLLSGVALERSKQSHAGDRPSLMELLQQVESDKDAKPAPAFQSQRAPVSRSWTSPLARQCTGIDQALRLRLDKLKRTSDSWRTKVPIHPTNYGKRFSEDTNGAPLDSSPRVVVMHETVYSLTSAINTFQTPHPRDEDQVSYHTLVGLDGKVVDVVHPLNRAYGAGNSAFLGEWAVTNPRLMGSLNNFALHVSLETPESGANDASQHTGYTSRQYDALAIVLSDWIKRFKLSPAAITTHRHVDLGGERSDPRSFNWASLQYRLAALGDLCVS